MGHVWLARDERTGLDVSLKIIAREGKSGHRAEREARAASSLRHERCQRILALAHDPSHVYIAYEYIPGRTLREALRSGEIDDRAALEVAAQIADALAHAHRRGIVHRDVKPSNVLLAESEGIDVRLLDFGLAQMAEFDTLTALGDVPGTLAYISPERLQGLTATPAADVWGLGVLLWEALAGEHPFWGQDLVDTSHRIQQGAPSLESLRPDLPKHVLETVSAALVVNPQRRPSAERLAHELRSLPRRRKGKGSKPAAPARPNLALAGERLLPGALAGVTSGWVATQLPFYPASWPLALAATGAALGFAAPRAGLIFALAVTFFPLANVSLGLAIVYAVLAAGWTALTWKDARAGLLLAAGPLLAPLAALALLPVAAQIARGRMRRARHRRRRRPPGSPGGRVAAHGPAVRRIAAAARPRHRRLGAPHCCCRRPLVAAHRSSHARGRGAHPRRRGGGASLAAPQGAVGRRRLRGGVARCHRICRAGGSRAAARRRRLADRGRAGARTTYLTP